MTSFRPTMPRSPWPASAGWTKKAGVPVEARVAAIFAADMAALADTADDDAALRDPARRILPGRIVEEGDGAGEGFGEGAVERGGDGDEAGMLGLDGPPRRGGGMRRALALRLLRRLPLGERDSHAASSVRCFLALSARAENPHGPARNKALTKDLYCRERIFRALAAAPIDGSRAGDRPSYSSRPRCSPDGVAGGGGGEQRLARLPRSRRRANRSTGHASAAARPTIDAVVTGGVPEKPSANPAAVPVTSVVERVTPATAVDTSDGPKGIITGVDLRRRTVEDDPFAPLGIRVGTFIYYPAVTFSAGYTSNAAAEAGGSGAPLLGIAPEAVLKSDWARHAATLAMRAADVTYPGNSAPDLPTAEILATGRLDLADRWNVGLEGGYNYSTQSVSDPDFPTAAVTPPAVHDEHAVVALNGGAGRGVFTVAGKAERTVYDNAVSASGKTIDQSDRDNNQFNGRLRLGYEVTPVVTPSSRENCRSSCSTSASTTTVSPARAMAPCCAPASPSTTRRC